jgi:hypothetical protein
MRTHIAWLGRTKHAPSEQLVAAILEESCLTTRFPDYFGA